VASPPAPASDGEPEIETIDPAWFAQMVAQASDDDLRKGLDTNRKLILGEVFRRMAHHLHADRASGVDAVVEWRIEEGATAEADRWQVAIRYGSCEVVQGGALEPSVTFTIAPVDFIRLVTGNTSGPKLFMFGRLKVDGDLMLAARMPSLFAMPGG